MAVRAQAASTRLARMATKFEEKGAIDPEHAMTLEHLGISKGWYQRGSFESMLEAGFIVRHTPDTYYLNVPAFSKYRRRDLTLSIVFRVIVIIILLAIYIIGEDFSP